MVDPLFKILIKSVGVVFVIIGRNAGFVLFTNRESGFDDIAASHR
jgi:hypothetical protein